MTNNIIFDDIGSYPLPTGISREWMENAILTQDIDSYRIIINAMKQKIKAGVHVPNYPQFQDMNKQFLNIINHPDFVEQPFLVKEDCAIIKELKPIEIIAGDYFEETKEKLKIRICVTGPIELYLKQFGGTNYLDILLQISKSVDRFIKNSLKNARYIDISIVSIDEPSIGINPEIKFEDADIIDALSIAAQTCRSKDIDTEIHLHSPLHYNLVTQTPINIIGVESAANPSYLDLIDKKDLKETDTFLRVGVARTDIYGLTAVLNEKYGINVWKEMDKLKEIITDMETPEVIKKRLEKAYKIFGDCITHAGPDCGLSAWPNQELAFKLLENTGKGIKEFFRY
ncbi:MAG: methionine synthase [Methanosarcinales archaeon]